MSTLNFNTNPENYEIVVTCSPIFECALGIAAYTWPVMADKLERTPAQWQSMVSTMSAQTKSEVDLAGQVHTWRSLLFLAHRCPNLSRIPLDDQVNYFVEWMAKLGADLMVHALPYLGTHYEKQLRQAMDANVQAKLDVLQAFHNDPLIHPNLQYLFDTDYTRLAQHLRKLLLGWYEALPQKEELLRSLANDQTDKLALIQSMEPAEIVRSATNGMDLRPEPMTRKIWLVPQVSYRPFTISNRIPETSIYYYPVADSNMPGQSAHHLALQVANLHKAVGDVHRVRILQLLHRSSRSVTEIGQLLDLAKSTAHHHLTLLRSAGLVQIENGVYTLNIKNVKALGPRLTEYVGIEGEL